MTANLSKKGQLSKTKDWRELFREAAMVPVPRKVFPPHDIIYSDIMC